MGLSNLVHSKMFKSALRIGILCGIVSVLVDSDHIISKVFSIKDDRFAHPYLLIISVIIIWCLFAHLGRLYYQAFLKKNEFQKDLQFYYSVDRNKYRRMYKGNYENLFNRSKRFYRLTSYRKVD